MGISPMYQGETDPPWNPVVQNDGNTGVDLTGATNFVLTITSTQTPAAVPRLGNGTFSIVSYSNPAQIKYLWDPTDTGIIGQFNLQVSWTTATGKKAFADSVAWQVKAPGT